MIQVSTGCKTVKIGNAFAFAKKIRNIFRQLICTQVVFPWLNCTLSNLSAE